MNAKRYKQLPDDARKIREEVFVEEQGFQDEFDDIDGIANHLVIYENELPIGTCRFFYDAKKETYVIGRIAVVKEMRGKAVGAVIMQEAEKEIVRLGGTSCSLAAQVQAVRFYEKQGYATFGEVFYDEHCPHIWMRKELGE